MEKYHDLQLSEFALKALQEFYMENENKSSEIKEDWQLSQFWYSNETSELLAQELIKNSKEGKIACVSSPTAFKSLFNIMKEQNMNKSSIFLFEFDSRFEKEYRNNFIFYDYKNPLNISKKFQNYFDIILVDPPFLSEECVSKTMKTLDFLGKDNVKIIYCSGASVENFICAKNDFKLKFKRTNFSPKHEGGLQNEFCAFTNYESDLMKWKR